ncbi:MAG: glycogen/starch synthase [Bacteroidales bacterium]|nr:glycogen/starch synthase [Bacteroidales bacterium]
MSEPIRILYVNSEVYPYTPESDIAVVGRYLPQAVQEAGREIRSFMPRYGCINERRNQLHEVIRLSGMNIIVNDTVRPLIIKVASISAARMQVYFIDNDELFRPKTIAKDDKGNYFADSDERAIFFARGVLETVKKFRWKPDIVHCQGWVSQILPLYLKRAYNDDPIFSDSKVVLSLYNDAPDIVFSSGMKKKVLFGNVTEEDLSVLEPADGTNLAKLAIQYSDGVILGDAGVDKALVKFAQKRKLPVLESAKIGLTETDYIKEYNDYYNQILGI